MSPRGPTVLKKCGKLAGTGINEHTEAENNDRFSQSNHQNGLDHKYSISEIEGRDQDTEDPRAAELITFLKWSPISSAQETEPDTNDETVSLIGSNDPKYQRSTSTQAFHAFRGALQSVQNPNDGMEEVRDPCLLLYESTGSIFATKPSHYESFKGNPTFQVPIVGDAMQVFAPSNKEFVEDQNDDQIDFENHNSHNIAKSTGRDMFTAYDSSPEQYFSTAFQTPLKSNITGSSPRVVQTPHGPALLLTTPTSGQPTRVPSPLSQQPSTPQRKFQRWSDDEDAILRYAVTCDDESKPNWKKISTTFFLSSRSPLQCKSRWTKSLQPGILIGSWQEHEDERIRQLRADGFRWSQIAEQLPGRIGEHVRDRFVNFLDPDLKKTAWTKAEDRILFEQQQLQGNKWTSIAKFLPGRSENAVKNRWHNAKMTQRRRMRKHAAEQTNESRSWRARQHAETVGSDDDSVDGDESFDEDGKAIGV